MEDSPNHGASSYGTERHQSSSPSRVNSVLLYSKVIGLMVGNAACVILTRMTRMVSCVFILSPDDDAMSKQPGEG